MGGRAWFDGLRDPVGKGANGVRTGPIAAHPSNEPGEVRITLFSGSEFGWGSLLLSHDEDGALR